MRKPLTVWMPAVRAGSGADVFTQRLADALSHRGVRAIVSWFPHWAELAPDLLRAARAPEEASIIHANSAYAFAFAGRGIPLVTTEHHYTLDPAYRPFKSALQHAYHRLLVGPYLQRSYAASDAITTDSLFTASVLERVVGVNVTRVIPLWVDYELFSPHASAACAPSDVFRLLFVGNPSRRKGGDVIAPLARTLGPDFEIRCTTGLRQSRNDTLLPANVRMLGRVSTASLVDEYRNCDAVLVPSRYEGFGYSALEGMACAKPIVGFRCGAIEEVVGEAGVLCEIDDIEGLANACRRLRENRARAVALGHLGRERALGVFPEVKAAESYMALYKQLAS